MITSKKIAIDGDLLFAAVANEEHAVSCMTFCNLSQQSSAYIDVYAVPGSNETGWMSDIGLIIRNVEILPESTYVFDTEKLVLAAGDAIRASSRFDDSSIVEGVVATISTIRVK